MALRMRSATLPALVTLSVANIAALPEGPGLSASHPHDVGMAGDPAVLLAENFEIGTLSDLAKRWDDVSNEKRAIFEFSTDQPLASGGKRSLQMTAMLGENAGGHLYKKLPREVDTAFARFYPILRAAPRVVRGRVWDSSRSNSAREGVPAASRSKAFAGAPTSI